MIKKAFWILLSCAFLSGCATVFSGTSQNINIKAVDARTQETLSNVRCFVTDPSGTMNNVPGNPGSVPVSKSTGGSLSVTCKKDGYRQLNTAVGDSFNGTTLVNILFWPGFLVDAATGAYKKYPSHFVVSMEKISGK